MSVLFTLVVSVFCAVSAGTGLCAVERRQDPTPCSTAADCSPPGFSDIPETLVNCSNTACECRDCFKLNETSGSCEVDEGECRGYDAATQTCEDDRRSQKVAFLLSIFLSCTGAANFYIERIELAVPQLMIFILLLVCSVTAKLFQHFADREKLCLTVVTWVTAILAILAALVTLAWWIADMIIFLRNDRDDGDDCPLDGDL